MDYFSHGLWSYILFHRVKKVYYAILFGLLPDTLSWAIYLFYKLFAEKSYGRPVVSQIPQWVFTLYNISHSLIVSAFVILLISIFLRKVPLYIFAWPAAIIMDVFTHTRHFLPTPFLWPLSNWKFPGIRWGNLIFIIINYTVIIISLLYIKYINNRNKTKSSYV